MTFWNTAFGATQSAVLPTSKTAATITTLSRPTLRRLHSPNALKVPKHRLRSFGRVNISLKIIPASIVTLRRYESPNGQWNSFAVLDARKAAAQLYAARPQSTNIGPGKIQDVWSAAKHEPKQL
jgi:hypothetical protein